MPTSKAAILRDTLLDVLEQSAADQWPWPNEPDAAPAPVLDELEVVRKVRSGRYPGIRVALSDGRELTVTVEETQPPRVPGR
jgi:hypothetical protein